MLQTCHIIYCYRPVLPALLKHLQSHLIPSLHYLRVWCVNGSAVPALTSFLPQCANLRTLYYDCGWESDVPESVEEEMWKAAVRRCRNLEVVRVWGDYGEVSCDRLVSALKKFSEKEGIQALKLKRIVLKYWGIESDYANQVKHLLPALQ